MRVNGEYKDEYEGYMSVNLSVNMMIRVVMRVNVMIRVVMRVNMSG